MASYTLSRLGRFWHRENGVSAIEFAIVGPIHLALMLSILEIGLICTRISLLENAMAKASKFIYTGAAAGDIVTRADLENFICDQIGVFVVACEDNISLDLVPITDLQTTAVTAMECRDAAVDIEPAVQFEPGVGSSIVLMRVCITADVFVPGMGYGLAMTKTENNRYQIISTTAFVNEPF